MQTKDETQRVNALAAVSTYRRGQASARLAVSRRSAMIGSVSSILSLGTSRLFAQGNSILVGQVGPFTVLPTPDALQVRDGIRACFAQVNDSGGVRGRRLQLFTLDDEFNPTKFMQQFRAAIARRPVAMMMPIGSTAVGALISSRLLETEDTVVIGAIPGAEAFRQPGHPRLFHICAGDRAQIERIVGHCRTLGLARIKMLAQSVTVGLDGIAIMNAAAAAIHGLSVSSLIVEHDLAVLANASTEMVREAPQATILVGTPRFMADALNSVRKAGGRQAAFALSYLPATLAVAVAGAEGARGLGITQIVPNPNGQDLALQRALRRAMSFADLPPAPWSPFHLEGYIAARVLVEGLKNVDGPLSPTALSRALHSMGEINVDGFHVDFRRSNNGATWTDIAVLSAEGHLLY